MTPLRVDHTAIAVRDIDAALERYRQMFGLEASERRQVPDQRVEVAFLPVGDTKLELIMPTDAASGVALFIAQRGEALHHIGILVDDIRRELAWLEAQGTQLIDREPRPGPHGLIAFVHPKATNGVMVELVERVEDKKCHGR